MKNGVYLLLALGWLGVGSHFNGQEALSKETSAEQKPSPVLVTKTYPTRETTLASMKGIKAPGAFLESSGVVFPPGGFARWTAHRRRLVVCSTQENVDLVDALLARPQPKLPAPKPQFVAANQTTARAQLAGIYSYRDRLYGNSWRLELLAAGNYVDRDHMHMAVEDEITKGTWSFREGWIILKPARGSRKETERYFVLADRGSWVLVPRVIIENYAVTIASQWAWRREPISEANSTPGSSSQ